MGDPVAVESFGDLGEGVVGDLSPHPPDDRRLVEHDDQLSGMGELPALVPPSGVAQHQENGLRDRLVRAPDGARARGASTGVHAPAGRTKIARNVNALLPSLTCVPRVTVSGVLGG